MGDAVYAAAMNGLALIQCESRRKGVVDAYNKAREATLGKKDK